MGFPRQRVTPPRSPGFKMLHRRDWSPAPQLQDMTKSGSEEALDEARLVELDGIRRRPARPARHGHDLAADPHHQTGPGRQAPPANRPPLSLRPPDRKGSV